MDLQEIPGFQELVDRLRRDAEQAGGARLNTSAQFQGALYLMEFNLVEELVELESLGGIREGRYGVCPHGSLEAQIRWVNDLSGREHGGLLDDSAEFADVARPGIADQFSDGGGRQAFLVLVAGVPSREQVRGEDGDVDFPGA